MSECPSVRLARHDKQTGRHHQWGRRNDKRQGRLMEVVHATSLNCCYLFAQNKWSLSGCLAGRLGGARRWGLTLAFGGSRAGRVFVCRGDQLAGIIIHQTRRCRVCVSVSVSLLLVAVRPKEEPQRASLGTPMELTNSHQTHPNSNQLTCLTCVCPTTVGIFKSSASIQHSVRRHPGLHLAGLQVSTPGARAAPQRPVCSLR